VPTTWAVGTAVPIHLPDEALESGPLSLSPEETKAAPRADSAFEGARSVSIDIEPNASAEYWTREFCVGLLLTVAVLASGLLAFL
jgi:hypothetical protein